MNRYNPVHEDAMVADENGTHVKYADHVQALIDLVEGTPKGAAMESVESIAGKIAHEDLVYLDHSPPVYQQVDRMALERSIAAALRDEREKVAEWKKRAQHAEAEAMTLRDFERARNTVSRQSKAEAEL